MRRLWIVALFFLIWGCGGNKDLEVNTPGAFSEPDRLLFQQSLKDLGKSRYNVGRLTLNTLINTYPDSEFLPEAKYALAESFYREGGTSNLNQAETEFKDFITFFPADARADDAQLMVALTHVRQLEKPDRDSSQASLAETELSRMIESYPDSPLLDEAKQKLRGVQEILAEGEFKVGNQYFIRKSYRAAMGRYKTVLQKFPDFSKTPEVLFFMAESLRQSDNPESAIYYSMIVTDYPFSERLEEAKAHLTEMHKPIPEPNPAALARGQQAKSERGIFGKMFGGLGRRPVVSTDTQASSIEREHAPKDEPKEKNDINSKDGSGGSFTLDGKKKPR